MPTSSTQNALQRCLGACLACLVLLSFEARAAPQETVTDYGISCIFLGTGGAEPQHVNPQGRDYRRRTSSFFVNVQTNQDAYGILIDDGGGDFASALLDADVAWSEIDYTLYSHGHFDHFNPIIPSVYRLARFFWLDTHFRDIPLHVYGKNDIIESYKITAETIRAPILSTDTGYRLVNREGNSIIFLHKVTERETYTLKPFLSIIPVNAGHSSYNYYTRLQGTAVGYILSIVQHGKKKTMLYYPDVGTIHQETEAFILRYGKANPFKVVIMSAGVPFAEQTSTHHMGIRGIAKFFKNLVDAQATEQRSLLYLTHLSPRWSSAEVNVKASQVMAEFGLWHHYRIAEDGKTFYWLNE